MTRGAWRGAACLVGAVAFAGWLRPWGAPSQRPADAPHAGARSSAPVILRRGNGPEPESLDLHVARSEAALTILRDLYEGLTAVDADGLPVPAAADSWSLSADGTTYRFHVRTAARWSDGSAVTAEDFAAAWRRLVDPRTAAQYADILAPLRGAAAIAAGRAAPGTLGVRADGAATLVVELTHPVPYFLGIVAHPATFPIHRASLAAHGRGYAKPGIMVSNGGFVLTRWDFGSHLVARRNPAYWNDAATGIDAVEYYSFGDAATELRAFRTGLLDVTSTVPAAQIGWIRERFGPMLHVAPQLAVYYLGFNLRKPPFSTSPDLRRALSMVIDRERLVHSVTGAGETPAFTFVPPAVHDYAPPLPDYASWPMPERVERARALLRAAGLAGRLPTLELRYNSGELHARIAVAVAAMWKQSLGIETTLRAEEFKVLLQDIDRGDAALFRASWLGDYNDAMGFLQVLGRDFGINLPHYANPRYDELLARAAADPDAAGRRAALARAETLMLADQPLIPLYFYVSKHLVDTRIGGWRDNALDVTYSKDLTKRQAGPAEPGGGRRAAKSAAQVAFWPPTL